MVKCPACGFESPDEAPYCDFCKEPFRRGRADKAQKKPAEPAQGIPSEFSGLDHGGSIPPAPPWLRYASWGILAAWAVVVMGLLGAFLARQSAGDRPARTDSAR